MAGENAYDLAGGNIQKCGEYLETIDAAFAGRKNVNLASSYNAIAKLTYRTIARTIKAINK